jgi:gamma-glutamylcyclotransferase (GGCT)/AIG2-like uncharacterized protein YtfP
MNKKITVYGSLLEGLGNWKWHLDNPDSKKLGEHILEDNLVMISFGGFPGLLVDETVTNKIFVETYEVTDEVFKRVERLEGYPSFYTRRPVSTPYGDSEIYVLNRDSDVYSHKNLVPKGEDDVINWRKYRNKY